MFLKIFWTFNIGFLMCQAKNAANSTEFEFSKILVPVPLNFSDFLNTWKANVEKVHNLPTENATTSSIRGNEIRQKRKELESKFIALQNLYDEKNWRTTENEHFPKLVDRSARQMPATTYDSLLTRRTFIPSLKTILIELTLMTLSIVAINAIENAMAPKKKTQKVQVTGHYRLNGDHVKYADQSAFN